MATKKKYDFIQSRDLNFQAIRTSTGDIKVAEESAAIEQSIYTILFCSPGDRVMEPAFGAGIERFLSEPATEQVGKIIAESVYRALVAYENRINILNVNINVDNSTSYSLTITYQRVNSNEIKSITYVLTRV